MIADGHKKLAGEYAKKAKCHEVAEYLSNEVKRIKNDGKIEQSQEKINAVNESSHQDNKKASGKQKKEAAAPKQSYKIVFMSPNGESHDLTQEEIRELVKNNEQLEKYLSNPDSIPQ